MKLLHEYNPEINISKEKLSLAKGLEYFQGEENQLLYSSRFRWNSMSNSLIELKRLSSFSYEKNIDYSFLEVALAKLGSN
jgi:hypothetical protein